MRKLLILPLPLLAFAYLAWPAWSAWQLRTAVKARDLAAIEARVDWPLLRANLKQTIRANLTDETKDSGGVIRRTLKRTVGPFVADRVVEAAVTPRTLARVLAGRALVEARKAEPTPGTPADTDDVVPEDPLSPRRLRWAFFETPTRFRIETTDSKLPGKRIVSILALQGTAWRLVDVFYEARA